MSSGTETCSGEIDLHRMTSVTSVTEYWIDDHLLTILSVVMLIAFLIGVLRGWQCRKAIYGGKDNEDEKDTEGHPRARPTPGKRERRPRTPSG